MGRLRETYVTENPVKWGNESQDVLWWSKGGVLRGQSAERIKFLRAIQSFTWLF